MQDIAFMVFSGISMFLVLAPISWHVKALNTGTLSFIFYVWFGNMMFFVNSIVWYGKLGNPAPVWCDIATKMQIGISVGLPAACLCINRRLYRIGSLQDINMTPELKRKIALRELPVAVGLPVLVMALHYIVQGHRFDVIQGVGCWADTYWSWPAIWLVLQWPFTLGIISLVYGCMAFLAFRKQHKIFNEVLRNRSMNLMNKSRYVRLMALSCGEMLFTLPLGGWIFCLSLKQVGINPWISWDFVHYDWWVVSFHDDFVMQVDPMEWIITDLSRWCLPISAIVFFCFFGLSGEAIREYRTIYKEVVYTLRIRHRPTTEAELDLEAQKNIAKNPPRSYEQFAKEFNLEIPIILPPPVEETFVRTSSEVSHPAHQVRRLARRDETQSSSDGLQIMQESDSVVDDVLDIKTLDAESADIPVVTSQLPLTTTEVDADEGSHSELAGDSDSAVFSTCCKCHLPCPPASLS